MQPVVEPSLYEILDDFLGMVLLHVIPLLDAIGTMMIIAGVGFNPFVSAVAVCLSLMTIAKVSQTNVRRHMNNVRQRSSHVLNFLNKLIKSNDLASLLILFLIALCLCNALIFSAFRYQSYYFACYVYLKQFGINKSIYSFLSMLSYIMVMPASMFSVFSHLSDVYSTCRRLNDIALWVKDSMKQRAYRKQNFLYFFASVVMLLLSYDFAVISYQNMLYKHINYLAICPDSIFKKLKLLLRLLFPALVTIEVLRGLNFVRVLIDLCYDWENKDFRKVDLSFCTSAFFVSALSAYNYSKINFSFKSVVIGIPMFTNNIINNVKWDKIRKDIDLHYYAKQNNCAKLCIDLNDGADINAQNEHLQTPLHIATANGHVRIIEALLLKGANCQVNDESGLSPLSMAMRSSNRGVTNAFIRFRSDDLLINAAAWGDGGIFKNLLIKWIENAKQGLDVPSFIGVKRASVIAKRMCNENIYRYLEQLLINKSIIQNDHLPGFVMLPQARMFEITERLRQFVIMDSKKDSKNSDIKKVLGNH